MSKLAAIVLAGGKSSRMGRDKAFINYHGKSQVDYLKEVLEASGIEEVYFSVNESQSRLDVLLDKKLLIDREALGPAQAIKDVQRKLPSHDLLVVACDLPLIDKAAISDILGKYTLSKGEPAIFYDSSEGLPEPMFAIYRAGFFALAEKAGLADRRCPRKILIELNLKGAKLPNESWLINVNSEADMSELWGGMVRLRYFAQLAEQRALEQEETFFLNGETVGAFYERLQSQHNFTIAANNIGYAINDRYVKSDYLLRAGDKVVFIPPVNGG